MAAELNSSIALPLDVTSDQQIDDLFQSLRQAWDGLDGIVHSIGFAPRNNWKAAMWMQSPARASAIAHDISAYSFAALAKAGREMMGKKWLSTDHVLPRRRPHYP